MNGMCRRAIQEKLAGIAFTEHVDLNPSDPDFGFYNDNSYSAEIAEMKNRYSESLKILKGIEFGEPHLYKREFEKTVRGEYDVILGSVHMMGDKFVGNDSILSRYSHSLESLFTEYYKIMTEMVEFGHFDVLAHFDFPKRYYKKNIFEQNSVMSILETIIEKNIALEINTSPLRKDFHECAPDRDIISLYADLGGTRITIGSDAHIPEDIAADFNHVFTLLEEFPSLIPGYFEKRRFFQL